MIENFWSKHDVGLMDITLNPLTSEFFNSGRGKIYTINKDEIFMFINHPMIYDIVNNREINCLLNQRSQDQTLTFTLFDVIFKVRSFIDEQREEILYT